MYIIRTEQTFDSAHFLAGYDGKCRNIHGHCWRVVIEVAQEQLNEDGQTRGMIVDFAQLKKDLKQEADYLDHSLIMESGTLREKTLEALGEEGFRIVQVPFRPTAEHFAKYFYNRMTQKGYLVKKSVVYETANNCAAYSADGEVSYEF
jgi:6-pyruvoyltetrahydropterin/6-carboxytetrahydropterin synthase